MMKKTILFLFAFLALVSLTCAIIPDDDSDGIPNSEDNCSNSNGTVDSFGCDCDQKNYSNCNNKEWCCLDDEFCIEYDFRARCTGDSDNDNVFDIDDKCAGTNPHVTTDGFGCSCSQKACDDGNPCTDDKCDNKSAECVFVVNERCKGDGIYPKAWWEYNLDKGEIKIYYPHSGHSIDVNFEESLKDDIIILDSTSNVISYGLNENRTKLSLIVEGDPKVQGVTTIKTMQKPTSVSIDKIEIPEREEKLSPVHYIWVYLFTSLIIAILIVVLILSLKKHEDKLLSSIRKGENKLEREVDLEAELQLKMYIITNLKRGYTAQQIRNELLRDGWRKETVDRAFNSLRR